jgi:hypothetical protein
MKVTLEDAVSLLSKYAEEQTPVLAVLGTPSVSVARVAGTIRVSIVGGVHCLLIGKEDSETDQIKFWLSDCEFAYGDFRDEEPAEHKFEGFLVVASKGAIRYPCLNRKAEGSGPRHQTTCSEIHREAPEPTN